ncbi:hypothetical protein CP533_6929 [Ophiocordyceps camponoti-saundersi (nom. inval.)]|nr:hypothetical protein CP533_6929 [Ophiocordyceps camponoti-saundersi (nom. inval.)]
MTVDDAPEKKSKRLAVLYILLWILFSNGTILFNKWIMDSAGFKFRTLFFFLSSSLHDITPNFKTLKAISLTCGHLIFTTLATQLLSRTSQTLDTRHRHALPRGIYMRAIVPIGIFYSSSLMLSNISYLHLSVAFIQMLKAASPIATLLMSWAWGLADPSVNAFLNVVVIVVGAALSSIGDGSFSLYGFSTQITAIVFEAVRIVMIQYLLSDVGFHIEPLVGLYYYAPVCAVFTFLFALKFESSQLDFKAINSLGFSVLFLNAFVAFMVNVTSVLAIKKTSGLVMTLTGITKNAVLIIVSAAIWHTYISTLQAIGYAITLVGLFQYSFGFMNLARMTAAYIPLSKDGRRSVSRCGTLRKLVMAVFIIGLVLITSTAIIFYSQPSPTFRPLPPSDRL